MFLTLLAANITADKTRNEPKLAAIAMAQLENEIVRNIPPKTEEPKISKATPKLAPEEIPNTKGPAKGFLKSVCINKPLIDNPDPTKTAVIAFGILKFRTIVCQLSLLDSSPKMIEKTLEKGIETEPKLMLINQKSITTRNNSINCFVYFLWRLNYLCLVKKLTNF